MNSEETPPADERSPDTPSGDARAANTLSGDTRSTDTPPSVSPDAVVSVAAPFRLQFETAQDSWVLLYPEGMVKLNQSGGEILKRCDGERTVASVVTELEHAFDQQGLTDDVCGFLGIALQQRWIRIEDTHDQ